jgi:hypothetical protein
MIPHGLVNVGNETLKVVGFFSESEIVSSFNEPVQPFGAAVLNQGARAPYPPEPPPTRAGDSVRRPGARASGRLPHCPHPTLPHSPDIATSSV